MTLSNKHFYHQLTKKYIILFGNIFNNITLIRYNASTGAEIERKKVPLIYGPKEKYQMQNDGDPELAKEIQIALPRMSYECTGIQYDANRKLNSLLHSARAANTSSSFSTQYNGVPYDLTFDLNIYTRNLDDGYQIVEQILPYFAPDYTVTATLVNETSLKRDIPIILNSVQHNIDYEGTWEAIRKVEWNLSFTMKGYFFGPISRTGLIRTVIVNMYNDPSLKSAYITRVNVNQGNNGTYKLNDIVYQGPSIDKATAAGFVVKWDANNSVLHIGATQGTFVANANIKSETTNAVFNLLNFEENPLKLVKITTTPIPSDAEPDDDYGISDVIIEYPETLV